MRIFENSQDDAFDDAGKDDNAVKSWTRMRVIPADIMAERGSEREREREREGGRERDG